MSLPPAEEAGDLPLGPGDLIEVSVFDVPELSNLKFRIPNSGQVTLPLIGVVTANGLTAAELEAEIGEQLRARYMHHPQVSLFVHEHRSQRVSVLGAVRQGGVFTLTSRLRLADALAMAGGLADDAAPTVYLVRRVGTAAQAMTVIDLESLVAGREELNLPLQAGDVVEVPRAGTYYVGGEVNRPGSFPLRSRTTLDQAPVAAGGVRDVADRDDIRLYRTRPDGSREVRRFSLKDFEAGRPAPELQANDIVIVGKSEGKAFLYAVRDFFRFGIGASASIPLY